MLIIQSYCGPVASLPKLLFHSKTIAGWRLIPSCIKSFFLICVFVHKCSPEFIVISSFTVTGIVACCHAMAPYNDVKFNFFIKMVSYHQLKVSALA